MLDLILFGVFYLLVLVNIILASFTEKKISKRVSGDEEDENEANQSFEIDGKKPLVIYFINPKKREFIL